MKKNDQTSKILGLSLFSRRNEELLNNLTRGLESPTTSVTRPKVVFTPNPEQVVLASRNSSFAQLLPQADYLLPDGVGLVMASQLFSLVTDQPPVAERITGIDVTEQLLTWAADHQVRCLVIGGRGYDQHSLGLRQFGVHGIWQLKEQPDLYWLPGYEQVAQPTPEEESTLEAAIKILKPEIVFVAFGAPYQEQWIMEHLPLLTEIQAKVAMVVGGSFDVLLGKVPRAPQWMHGGGEWFFRLLKEPWRWKRQLQLLTFMKLVLQEFFRLAFLSPGKDKLKKEATD
jgi:N-acetylglucosaminyldiphosphoundecaprenol N-acetyl-beta-D-mannosaminyltransferase